MRPSSSSRPAALQGGTGVLARRSGEGRPPNVRRSGPVSDIAGARLSSRCGRRSCRRASSVSWCASHKARPSRRPAPLSSRSPRSSARPLLPRTAPPGVAAWASCSSKRKSSKRSGRAVSPRASSSSRAIGKRCSFQRPGARFAKRAFSSNGASAAAARSCASPLKRVCGAPAHNAAKSRLSVAAFNCCTGQASSGRTSAVRSSAGPARAPASAAAGGPGDRGTRRPEGALAASTPATPSNLGRPRKMACASKAASGPPALSTAAQGGASGTAISAGTSVARACKSKGLRLPRLAPACTCTP